MRPVESSRQLGVHAFSETFPRECARLAEIAGSLLFVYPRLDLERDHAEMACFWPRNLGPSDIATVFPKFRVIQGYSDHRKLFERQDRDTTGEPVKYFEVLAGAISWGFKSPSRTK